MKVLFINTYPMDEAYELWKKGSYPGHHLWGMSEFEAGQNIEVHFLKFKKYGLLDTLGKLLKIDFLDQQIRTLRVVNKYDLLYSPYGIVNNHLILFFKYLGFVKTPIVTVIHQPLFNVNSSVIKKKILKKLILEYDALVFLSDKIKNELISGLAISAKAVERKFYSFNWGVEMSFYSEFHPPKDPALCDYIVAAGKTGRDYNVLIEAFRNIGFPLKIFCSKDSQPTIQNVSPNVSISTDNISYPDLLREYNNARIILIPLQSEPTTIVGFTSLLDVFGMGKPVVLTKNPNMNIDIDEEGVGRTIEARDAVGWAGTVNSLINDWGLLRKMGERSFKLGSNEYSIKMFSNNLTKVFLKVHNNKQTAGIDN